MTSLTQDISGMDMYVSMTDSLHQQSYLRQVQNLLTKVANFVIPVLKVHESVLEHICACLWHRCLHLVAVTFSMHCAVSSSAKQVFHPG